VQFDLQYDGSAMTVVAIAGDALRVSGKSLYYKDLTPNLRRFIAIGLNQNSIPQGTLISLFLIVDPNALAGVHALTLTNLLSTAPAGESMPTVGVTNGSVDIEGPTGLKLQPAGILNAASLDPGSVSPGEIVTLIGSGIGPALALPPGSSASSTVLGDTTVLFDGITAPLLFASPNQINAIVPFGVSGQDTTQMVITSGGQVIAGLPLPVTAAAPAIFSLAATGVGPGAILNQDTSLNSQLNPADRGSVVAIYATGFGQTDPPGVDGQVTADLLPRPTLHVSVQIGGADAEVLYAGAAPGLVAGVFQINCRIPTNLAPGDSVAVRLIVGAALSPPGITLAIR
jgi:uncharacterized protein (TIGR03437 family)